MAIPKKVSVQKIKQDQKYWLKQINQHRNQAAAFKLMLESGSTHVKRSCASSVVCVSSVGQMSLTLFEELARPCRLHGQADTSPHGPVSNQCQDKNRSSKYSRRSLAFWMIMRLFARSDVSAMICSEWTNQHEND